MINADPAGARQVQRTGAPLVGPGQRVPAAARDQPAAAGLDRRRSRALAGKRGARRRLRRRHPGRLDGARAAPRCSASTWPTKPLQGGAAACARSRHARASSTARSRPRRWPPSSRAASTSSPAWRCSSTCPTRRRSSRACARAGQARRLGVLLDHQPQPQVVPVRHRRRRVRAEAAAARARTSTPSSSARASSRGWCRDAGLDLRAHARPGIQPADPALLAVAATPASTTCSPAASRLHDDACATPQAVLFDLDGTLIDSAPDLGRRRQRDAHAARPGRAAATSAAADGRRGRARHARRRLRRHARRRRTSTRCATSSCAATSAPADADTRVFDGVRAGARTRSTQRGMRWGIVTNKATRFTRAARRRPRPARSAPRSWSAATPRRMPSRIPAPLLEAARRARRRRRRAASTSATTCATSQAGRAAGMRTRRRGLGLPRRGRAGRGAGAPTRDRCAEPCRALELAATWPKLARSWG